MIPDRGGFLRRVASLDPTLRSTTAFEIERLAAVDLKSGWAGDDAAPWNYGRLPAVTTCTAKVKKKVLNEVGEHRGNGLSTTNQQYFSSLSKQINHSGHSLLRASPTV